MDSLLPFAGLAALIVLSPGPDLALVTRSLLAGGRRAGLLTALGIGAGATTWALVAAAGLATLLSTSPHLLDIIRWLGAGYLAWIGVRALLTRPRSPAALEGAVEPQPGRSFAAFRIGLISNLLHPGQVVFYTSMLPQFIDPDGDATLQALTLGGVFALIVVTWFSGYALVASRLPLERWDRITPILTRVTGVVLIGFAVRLAARL